MKILRPSFSDKEKKNNSSPTWFVNAANPLQTFEHGLYSRKSSSFTTCTSSSHLEALACPTILSDYWRSYEMLYHRSLQRWMSIDYSLNCRFVLSVEILMQFDRKFRQMKITKYVHWRKNEIHSQKLAWPCVSIWESENTRGCSDEDYKRFGSGPIFR